MLKSLGTFFGNCRACGNGRAILWLLLVLAVVAIIRIRLLEMPLERDEGEYAYAGQLLLQGVSPYKAAYNVTLKLPGTCVAYALALETFGQTRGAIHGALILVNLATVVVVFLVMRRMGGDGAGVVAAAIFALLSISPPGLGLAAHATHFVMLPALAGIFLLQDLDEHTPAPRVFFAGLLLGLALLMKQTGAAFGLFAMVWIVWCERSFQNGNWRRLAVRSGCLAAGGLLPFLVTCGLIIYAGDFASFRLWTFQYAYAHEAVLTFMQGINTMIYVVVPLFKAAGGLWSLAGLGLLLLFGEPSLKRWRLFIVGFVFFSCVAVWPGWRPHYFIQLFPAAGILAGVAFRAAPAVLSRLKFSFSPTLISLPVFSAATLSPLIQWNDIYFRLTPEQATRKIYNADHPFVESVMVGEYLAERCPPEDRIVVLGSEPQIYFYSQRRSVTGYICTFPLMEPQPYAVDMHKEMIRQIEQGRPEYVIFVHTAGSWWQYRDSNTMIFDWFGPYQRKNLELVGLVEIRPGEPTQYRWFDQPVTNMQTSAERWLAIFKRRAAVEIHP